ncbi:MAG: hypothetical protein M1825_005507 [Sarcosagium campestre]|nr:MAG: hypothetical protein M1825_005507 [Sarcosagium campestre]
MAGRVQQDSFIDDSDETCPLCVEEFDLSDRNFRPCPCGYQVCQFCFNNIKNNMNGLCPACRRPYNDETIEWKVISPEEFKADVQKQARKKADQRQREVQKREVESLNRKHLSGLRVVQKNLVYVTGLTPRIREEDLLHTLRGERYFGQYGKIVKIVVSKSKDAGEGSQPLGVYVTFARKQDAESCIAAVDGSDNGGRTLRAQFGTTKYCSAYLRNETCSNKNCMFLHEPGEEKDSFTRQDLSSINVVSTQRPAQSAAGPSTQPGQPSQSQASTEVISQPPSAAQSMQREPSRDEIGSPTDSQDSSALPSSASWAIKNQQQASRRTSQAASASTPSPHLGNAGMSSQSSRSAKDGAPSAEVARSSKQAIASSPPSGDAETSSPLLNELLKSLTSSHISFVFAKSLFAPDEYTAIANHPQLFDPAGGAKRRAIREAEEKERRHADEQAQKAVEAAVDPQAEEIQGGGSLQLGGEPEGQQSSGDVESRPEQGNTAVHEQHRQVIQPPSLQSLNFGPTQPGGSGPNLANLAINGRGLTQSQQQHLMLLKSNSPQSSSFLDQLPQGLSQPQQTPTYLQSQAQHYPAIHGRQSSRYTFANDTASASASVKPAANAKLMAQQSSMMPAGNVAQSQASQGQQHQQSNSQFYGAGLQGPPPGLKSAGTPPISGGGMFSQGHGFAGSAAAGMGTQMDGKSDLFRDALRSRSGVGGVGMGPGLDGGKRESMFPSFLQQYPSSLTPAPGGSGHQGSLYGSHPGAFHDHGSQKQKKKGKKHRHANTSSFGGGGIVDLADPNLLQARMQQQSGSGAVQGLFSGQAQGGYNPVSAVYGGSFGRW